VTQSTTVACSRCGALNGADFGSCIRCNQPLLRAEPAARAVRRVPAPLRRAPSLDGPGAEPLFGRWPPEELPATKLIIFINLVVFAGHLIGALQANPGFETIFTGGRSFDALRYGALPLGTVRAPPLDPLIMRAEPWRLLSACFVHFGPLHLGMNMLSLVYLARLAEPAFGSVRFVILYTLAGIFGFFTSAGLFLFTGSGAGITAGASGAVFGVMGMILGFFIRRRDPQWKPWLGRVVIMSLAISLIMPMSINHAAHLGGLVSGALLGALFAKGAPKPSALWQRALASLCVLAVLGSLLASRLSPYYDRLSG
jgi:membrane associated rhomboid family serine protease